jgi:hypothetical protein
MPFPREVAGQPVIRVFRPNRSSLPPTRLPQHATRQLCNPTSRGASGTRSTELNLRPNRATRGHHSTPRTTWGTDHLDLVDQRSAYARPVQPCAPADLERTQPRTCSAAAARTAPPCHGVPYAGLIRPREKAPRNSDLRHEPQREPAGHSIVHTQASAKNQTN